MNAKLTVRQAILAILFSLLFWTSFFYGCYEMLVR